ncbi:peptidase S8/S53 domain-containing protein [Lactarius akahatsu]|uniref:tripeptidyl-peptidase II n=1 Tax=Lactarius akahatsu TaxID=416441 RepID=A0AAD4Q8U5_9AGAM|nr:peptidase S8/S53 domain-containing protein [Lactarius akahatsu]
MRYRWVPLLFLLSTVSLGGIATSPWDDMRSEHSWKNIPENWVSLGLPIADTTIDLYIALKPYRENALVDALNEISDPGHSRYGVHLSREQVTDLVAPHPDTIQLVHSWLEHHRITSSSVSVTHGGSFLTVTAVSVSQANDLLGASYQLYTHTKTNETIVRTLGYSLPVVLHGHVQTVAPTTFFSSPLTQWQTPRKRSDVAAVRPGKSPSRRDDADVTLASLRWLYSTVTYVPSAMDRNKVGVTGYNEEYPSPADLKSYMLKYRPDGIDATYVVELVNGGKYDPSNPGTEANLNIQLSEGMTYPTPHIFYSTKASPSGDSFLAWLNAVLSEQNVPQTITTSYGFFENVFPKSYAIRVCNLFAQLGARGASVLFASGDDGVGRGDCSRFTPIFPATCPYVTVVGATMSLGPEVAASLSGGGFSDFFDRPEYQQQAVSTFLDNLGHQYSGLYNPLGRGIPDISAQARRIPIFHKGEEDILKGTSCSAPIVSGIISLLNDYRLSQGKPPLGFLNPWLYGGGLNGLNDIVSGSNPGCNTDGFSAVVGWDPVTGLGTPDFLRLMHTLDPGSSNPPE